MRRKSRGLRRAELVLWVLGVVLLGLAIAATAERWSYQAEQERALLRAAARPDEPGAAGVETPRRDSLPVEISGPVPPPNAVPPIPKKTIDAESAIAERPAPAAVKPPKKRREAPPDPAAFGRIEIPRIGVRAVIRKGADEDTLERAVGLVPGSVLPGEVGNAVLAAHRDTFFRPLRKIRVADRIRVVVPPNEYVYEVESTRVVTPEETSVLQSRGAEELTLVTCYPFFFVGPAPDRFIVSAKRVQ